MIAPIGTTARQIREAPKGAVYVCAGFDQAHYLKAKQTDRPDIRFVGLQWLVSETWRGQRLPAIVLDHFAAEVMSEAQRDIYRQALASCCAGVSATQYPV